MWQIWYVEGHFKAIWILFFFLTSLSFGQTNAVQPAWYLIFVFFHCAYTHSFKAFFFFKKKKIGWISASEYFSWISLSVHFECADSFCLPLWVLIVHSFIWFDFFSLDLYDSLHNPLFDGHQWIPLPKVISPSPFLYYTVRCLTPNPVPRPVVRLDSEYVLDF